VAVDGGGQSPTTGDGGGRVLQPEKATGEVRRSPLRREKAQWCSIPAVVAVLRWVSVDKG
jgi:hypothetical protein